MEQFEQLLTCAICLDRYRNPKLLPCQHSFCMEPCMDGLVDYVRRQVKCPECRAEHRIPYQGVQAFPTNVTLQRFLELHIEITGELPDPTSGQTMERCGVCSEKSYCALCVHCEKKCCPECKDAHMDILRREITRINSQVRRGLHRLQDALALVEKNTLGLQTNSASVAEEVDEIYRRLSKALKDRTEHLRNEIDRYLGTELRGLIQLKGNLELEIANIQSNCDLAEAHINENVPWDDAELLDTKELFLRTVEFIKNFEYEAGDYGRRVRFVMAHDPNQLVLHVAGYGELNIKPEAGTGGLLGSSSGSLAPPGGSPGLMRSKSDHRLASQYRQPDDDRISRTRYVPDYEYEAPEYEAPRNKSRYRSRFMRHRDGEDSDGDTRTTVRFTGTQDPANPREKVLDTEDAARGPLSGIFRLTDSPRVMKKLQECERAGKRKKEEPVQPQPAPQPKPQVQVRKTPTAMAKQVSEDDEISRIKKQNKNVPATPETVEERPPSSVPVHPSVRDTQEREPEDLPRRTPVSRRTSTEVHTQGARSASSDSSTGSESSSGSGIRNTGAPFTAEEMKQKYLSRAPPTNTTTSTVSSGVGGLSSSANRDPPTTTTSSPRPFQSRFLGGGNRAAPPPPQVVPVPTREEPKKKEDEDDDDDETTSSSEETESETDEESETETRPSTTVPPTTHERQRSESAMARTDIGPLLARSAEARRGSKEDSPSAKYSSPTGSPAKTTPTTTSMTTSPSSYTSRFVKNDHDIHDLSSNSNNPLNDNRFRVVNDESAESSKNNIKDNKIATSNLESSNFENEINLTKTKSDGNFKLDETPSSTNSQYSHNINDCVESTNSNGTESLVATGHRGSDLKTNNSNDNYKDNNREINDDNNGNNDVDNDSQNEKNALTDANKPIVGEKVIRNNDQNIFLSSRDFGRDFINQRNVIDDGIETENTDTNSLKTDLREKAQLGENEDHYNSKTDGHSISKEEAQSSYNQFQLEEKINFEKLAVDTNGKGTNNGKIVDKIGAIYLEREILRPIMEITNESEDTEDSEAIEAKAASKQNGIPKIVINESSSEDEEIKENEVEINNNKDLNSESEGEESGASTSKTNLEGTAQSIPAKRLEVENLLDDNGWIVSEDLDDKPPSSRRCLSTENKKTDDENENDERNEESNSNSDNPRSRIYRQSSIGKNGWMTSDDSESETEGTASTTLPEDVCRVEEEINNNVEGRNNSIGEWNNGEEGCVILEKGNEKKSHEQMLNGDGINPSENRFPIGDKNNDIEMTNAEKNNEIEEDEAPVNDTSMKMVTTVLCVSVLCCSVLFNLLP